MKCLGKCTWVMWSLLENPFADSESDSESDEPEDASDQVPSDPFLESNESECDTDDSELAYSEITDIEEDA